MSAVRKIAVRASVLMIGLLLLQVAYTPVLAQNPSLELISIAYGGMAANDVSLDPSISADGRYVAFESYASNIVPNDIEAGLQCAISITCVDIFVRDRQTGQTTLVSRSDSGEQANADSYDPVISANGQWVVFDSGASNLAPNIPLGGLILHSLQTGLNTRIDVSSTGVGGYGSNPSISSDGRFVAFESTAPNLVPNDVVNCTAPPGNTPAHCLDIYLRDAQTGETSVISVSSTGERGNGQSSDASISADGRYITFASFASNLAPNDTNGMEDVFVYDRLTGQTTRVSVSSSGVQGVGINGTGVPDMSANGRFVAFLSAMTNLVSGDTNHYVDAFVRDRQNNTTSRVSISSSGAQGNGNSYSTPLPPAISDNGRFTAFVSLATNMVAGDTNNQSDVFVHDSLTGKTIRLSVSSTGEQGVGSSDVVEMNGDGRFIVFESAADNLVPGYDNGGKTDIYLATNPLWTPLDVPPPNYYTALPITLTWSPLAGAVAYEVQMASNASFNGATTTVVSNGDLFLKLDTLADGLYYWRVRAKDTAGKSGAWSAIQSFTLNTTS